MGRLLHGAEFSDAVRKGRSEGYAGGGREVTMIPADPAMKIGHITVVLLCAHSVFLQACAVGRNHTSDAALERVFNQHQADFEALLAEVQADPRLTSIQPRSLVYAGRLLQ